MELFLYKCEVCGVCMFVNKDQGRTFYNICCGICQTWTYYEKVIPKVMGVGKESHFGFYCPTVEEKKDVSEEDRTNKKEQAYVDRSEH